MDFGGPSFVIAIIALSMGGWIINNWIRAKHGYDLEDEWGGKTQKSDNAETKRLKAENRDLNDKLDAMQDRMTDRGYSLSEEIEALRDVPASKSDTSSDSGVPLNLQSKEKQS